MKKIFYIIALGICLLYTSSMGKKDEHLYYLVLSAISDVRSAIKEQSSLMVLAQEPVSYTHLDVYKRQLTFFCSLIAPQPALSA